MTLGTGELLLFDEQDAGFVLGHRWRVIEVKGHKYVVTKIDGSIRYIHRLLLNAPAGMQVDHRDGNGLNNRRENIRLATQGQNSANKSPANGRRFKGITLHKGKWIAQIWTGSTNKILGRFGSPEEAARAYDLAAVARWGEYARLNFPTPT